MSKEIPIQETCIHKFIYLKSGNVYEVGYRQWSHDDFFFCEKCLKYEKVTIEEPKHQSIGAF